MNEQEHMEIVLQLDDGIRVMKEAVTKLHKVSAEDFPYVEDGYQRGDAFESVCLAKLQDIRDLAKLGYKRFELEKHNLILLTRVSDFCEYMMVDGDHRNMYSCENDNLTYGDMALEKARQAARKVPADNLMESMMSVALKAADINGADFADYFARLTMAIKDAPPGMSHEDVCAKFVASEVKDMFPEKEAEE